MPRDPGLGPASPLDGTERWRFPRPHPWKPGDEVELTPEEVQLHALEERLADVRRLLVHAGHVRCPFRPDVRALTALVDQLHHQVLEAVAR